MFTYRQNAFIAYIAPFAAFMLLTSLEGSAPTAYYPILYTIKIAVVAGLWLAFRGHYPRYSSSGVGLGVVAGVIGVVAWVGLAAVPLQELLPASLHSWVGGTRSAYNPFDAIGKTVLAWAFIGVRLIGLAVVVPLMEEVFWRGFLLRYLINDDFTSVPIGKLTPMSFLIVTALFTVVHPELLAAAVWCAGINLLCYRTGNLWACIATHAVTNLLLGVYVLVTGAWHLW